MRIAKGLLLLGMVLLAANVTVAQWPANASPSEIFDPSVSKILVAFKSDPGFTTADRIDLSTGLRPVSSRVPTVGVLLAKYSASYSRQLFVGTRLQNVYELAIKGDSSLAISELMRDPNINYARLADPSLEAKVSETINRINSQTGGVWVAGYTIPGIMTPEDRKKLLGFSSRPVRPDPKSPSQRASDARFSAIHKSLASGKLPSLPSSFDWRTYNNTNYITPAKNQGGCSSCWSFEDTGTVQDEANAYYNSNLGLNLSEQQLLSCSDAGTCAGGGPDGGLDYVQSTGLVSESCFPYTATDTVPCSNMCSNPAYWKISSWSRLPADEAGYVLDTDIQIGLLAYGPFGNSMEIYSDFYNYTSGIYYPTSGATDEGNHGVVVVGFGFAAPPPALNSGSDSVLYLSAKNSWGASWGENGFFNIYSGVANDNSLMLAVDAPLPPTAQNAMCQDLDGAGHCYWGLGPQPGSGCPSTCTSSTEYCAYNGSAQSPVVCLTSASIIPPTPAVTVIPASTSITTTQSLGVTVTVNGGSGNPTPSGSVTLNSGTYSSTAIPLSSGSAAFTIPAGSLALGGNILIAFYTPDSNSSSNYGYASGASTSVMVTNTTAPSFTLSGTAVSVAAGATSGNTSSITVTPAGGFTGSVGLTASVTSSPPGAQYPPILSFGSTTPVSITGTAAGTATLTISTTAATSATLVYPKRPGNPWFASGATTVVCILLLGIPTRRRGWRFTLGIIALLFAISSGVLACGGGGGGGGISGTTPGTYTITVTGTSGTLSETGTVSLTVQ
ncbi:MAG TPA: C1 family peptidase [Terracidiphilus sp.]|jgi:C1A family cysteine protease